MKPSEMTQKEIYKVLEDRPDILELMKTILLIPESRRHEAIEQATICIKNGPVKP